VFQKKQCQICVEEGDDKDDYHLHNGLLYKLYKLCVHKGEILQLIIEALTSKFVGHFDVGKTVANLQRYVYWHRMQDVDQYIRGCMICCTNKPSNRKKGLYHPLPIPTRPWESISMDFGCFFPTTKKGRDYIFVVIDRFGKMCILMPCKKTINGKEVAYMLFEQAWVHFGIRMSIISNRNTKFLSTFWTTLWEKMESKLKISTTFHPWKDG
jgi:hypothetical protein